LQHCYTFLLVVVGWVLFRAETLDRAQELYAKMFMLAPSIPDISAAQFLTGEELLAFGLAICFALPGTIKYIDRILSVPREPSPEHGLTFVRTAVGITVSAGVFALASIKIITGAFSPFIYFRF
jgi:alginate O-acetyltransferase complex protein AlgI